ncbi:MAG TPA: hypothetical protein PK264_03680 [Hyphomicrobiaceae bacterium]|nr:hypothetical protein [Hyphomicrobiaceae bacterium]
MPLSHKPRNAVLRGLRSIAVAALLLISLAPLAAEDVRVPLGQPSADALRKVQRWVWFTGPPDVAALAGSPATMVIVDPEGVSAPSVQRLKRIGRRQGRLVLAQIDIAMLTRAREPGSEITLEPAPGWLGPPACGMGWHRIRYWQVGWQDALFRDDTSYVMQLLARGYDGLVLGGIEAYRPWQTERWQAAIEMAELVSELAIAIKTRRPSTLILLRNGEEIGAHPDVLKAIDGIVRADLLYGARVKGAANSEATTARSVRNLAAARRAGLALFSLERIADKTAAATADRLARGFGLLPGESAARGGQLVRPAVPPAFDVAGWPHC